MLGETGWSADDEIFAPVDPFQRLERRLRGDGQGREFLVPGVERLAGRERCAGAAGGQRGPVPAGKTFDAWDEKLSSLPVATQSALKTLEWIDRRENLVVCGPSGLA